MPEPRSFLIVQNLQAALRAIAVAGGYHYSVASVAVKLDPNQANDVVHAPGGVRPLILVQVDPERRDYTQSNDVRMVLPLVIHWVHESDATDDDSRMQVFFRGCADVEQAIALDIGRGGQAIDTRIIRCVNNDDLDGSQVWAQIEVEVSLYRQYGSPNG
jgi:hypothetical protein